ncbi:biopolymer transporter ExbD [Myxococcaceae bacterium GXIMD 01537]
MAFHYSRRKLKIREEEETGELNIVPYLDILMNLIIFMLLSITGLASFGILNVNAPNYGGPTTGVAQEEKPDEQKLVLSVLISKTGHFVNTEHTVLGAEKGAPTVPLKADGTYDYEALTRQMVQIKGAVPGETKVIIAAEADTAYEVLIQTMDAIREDGQKRLLFPDVTLGAL